MGCGGHGHFLCQRGERLQHPGGGDVDSFKTLINGTPLRKTPALSPGQKLVLRFDDDQGVFYQPGGEGSRARLDWQIDLALLNGSDMKNQDNGGDWIIDLHPKKLHG